MQRKNYWHKARNCSLKKGKRLPLISGIAAILCTACTVEEEENSAEVPTIRVMAWAAGHTNENRDLDLVNKALGDLTEKKIGCRLELVYSLNILDYRLILGSKEKMENQVDIVGMYSQPYWSYAEEGYLMNLDSFLEQYGEGIFEVLECDAEELKIKISQNSEGIYGIPKAMPEINIIGVAARKDLLEKYHFSLDEVKTLEDLEPFLECIAQNEELSPIVTTAWNGNFFINDRFDLVDSAGAIAVRKAENFDRGNSGFELAKDGIEASAENDFVIENFFETPEFENYIMMMKRWREKGILTNQLGRQDELGLNLVVAGKAAVTEIIVRPDETEEWLGMYGDEIEIKGFDMKPFMTTSDKWRYNWCVSSECQYPELAVQALELMYTDPEVNNLMLYGIQDIHYVVDEEGFFGYPEGVDQNNVGYFTNEKWQFNRKIGGLWEGMSKNQRQEMEEFNAQAVYSPIYGFVLDEEPIENELNQIQQVIYDSYFTIQAGFGEGQESLEEFQARLQEAGIEKVKKEVERQILQWKAES